MLSSKEAQFPLACFSNTYSSLIQCFLNTYSSLNSQYTSICFQILFRSEVQAIPSQIKVWIGSQLLSAVETFEICLKSETSLVSFLPTTLFTPARDLHRERVPKICHWSLNRIFEESSHPYKEKNKTIHGASEASPSQFRKWKPRKQIRTTVPIIIN